MKRSRTKRNNSEKSKTFLVVNILVLLILAAGYFLEVYEKANIEVGETTVSSCFTPGMHCAEEITNAMKHANESIYIQAYSFTSKPIRDAIIDAWARGVKINIIVDRSQVGQNKKYSIVNALAEKEIPIWVDSKPAIAHNKIMIIDNEFVLTGSYNYTQAAEKRNAENVVIIHDKRLAHDFFENWMKRMHASTKLESYQHA